MTDFWPSGLHLDDISSPLEILQTAQQEWTDQGAGLLALVIQETKSSNNYKMLIVHAKHVPSNRTVTLFSVLHRPDAPYPARIQPRDGELPDFFKKSYYRRGIADFTAGISGAAGGEVTNKWVCDSPFEFRSKLREIFNQGTLKSEILSLVSGCVESEEASEDTEGSANEPDTKPNEGDS